MTVSDAFPQTKAFSAKWIPVRVKKTRQNKKLEPRSDSIGTEKALASESRDKHQAAEQHGDTADREEKK
jgi:hypothetical protein